VSRQTVGVCAAWTAGRRPIIDLANQSLLAALADYSEVKIIASFERIQLSPSHRAFAIQRSRTLAPPFRVLEVFAGGGTMTAALTGKAAFQVVAGVEINPDFADEWQARHPDATLVQADMGAGKADQLVAQGKGRIVGADHGVVGGRVGGGAVGSIGKPWDHLPRAGCPLLSVGRGELFFGRARPLAPGGQRARGRWLRQRMALPHPQSVPSALGDTLNFTQPVNRPRGVTMYRGRAAPALRFLLFPFPPPPVRTHSTASRRMSASALVSSRVLAETHRPAAARRLRLPVRRLLAAGIVSRRILSG
jgi:hypothetical protein